MSEEREAKTGNSSRNWAIASIACGFLGSWLFSQYGESVLGAFFPTVAFLWPVALVALGIFAGWQLKKWRTSLLLGMTIEEAASRLDDIKEEQRRRGELRERLLEFPLKYKDIVFSAVENETVTLYRDDKKIGAALAHDGLLAELDASVDSGKVWSATDLARSIIHEEDYEVWDDLRNANREMHAVRQRKILDVEEDHFRNLKFEQKVAVYRAWTEGFVDYYVVDDVRGSISACRFLVGEYTDENNMRYTINPEYADLLQQRGDALFAVVKECLASKDDNL